MLRERLITAFVLLPAIILTTLLAPTSVFSLIIAVFIGIAAWEWSRLVRVTARSYQYIYVLLAILIMLVLYRIEPGMIIWIVLCGIAWWLFAIWLAISFQSRKDILTKNIWINLVIGLLVLIPAWSGLVELHRGGEDGIRVLELFVLIWVADSAAYLCGKLFGKHRLADRISPGKSWEGVAGALIVTTGLTALYGWWTEQTDIITGLIIVSIVTVSFSILGDLSESIFKRRTGFKDSGKLLPGHGGVLDRIDSLTAASPVYYASLMLMDQVK